MAYNVIDRRKNQKGKSTSNRQKFVRRVSKQVKRAVREAIREGSIEDIVSDKKKKVTVPVKDLSEPHFHHSGDGGTKEMVHPGNKEFIRGDRVNRPPDGGGKGAGGNASDSGEGDDNFEFHLTKEEFLEIFFEDLELPDLMHNDITTIDEFEWRRAGFSTDGSPSKMNIVRTMKQSKGRLFALRKPKKRKLKKLEAERDDLNLIIAKKQSNAEDVSIEKNRLKDVLDEIVVLKRKIKAIPFVDNIDLRYNRSEKVPIPTTQAVMFCIMDVSGSMGEWEKEMSKRFFMLLYLFLTRNYERVELVFIRHHTIAKEVDEEEFFYSRESGGTLISPALELMDNIIDERYPINEWNIYGCQASDGDNWGADSVVAQDALLNKILPKSQYFSYIEIGRERGKSDIWDYYQNVKAASSNFAAVKIGDASEIYPVFRGLFEKRSRS